jgi:DNA-binding response OmpR family regulator/DNA-binding CsgD family transcriptional regulator
MSEYKALVLVVDDTPDTLALLHNSLEKAGYTVLVATNGKSALKICNELSPEIVLLDAVMPGMDGFEVCKTLKDDLTTRHIPVIFMTGLTDTEHVVAGFSAGGTDYVTKPLNENEVIARLEAHLGNARMMRQTRSALDAFGQASIALLPGTKKVIWQTPLAKRLLNDYLQQDAQASEYDLSFLDAWLSSFSHANKQQIETFKLNDEHGRLVFSAADISDEQWLIVIQEESEQAQMDALRSLFTLTKKESEVLYWATMGKTDKLISQILGSSPRTVNKHMEHVLIKLGAESRTAAAAMALSKLHSSHNK